MRSHETENGLAHGADDDDSRTEESRRDDAAVKGSALGAGPLGHRPDRRSRKPVITDGPFTETKELLGEYAPPRGARR